MARSRLSAAKIAANRANAKKSTGPKTEEGKARSSRNAIKHGLYSLAMTDFMDGWEFKDDYERYSVHKAGIHASYRPSCPQEASLADRIAAQEWRLYRLMSDREAYRCLHSRRDKYSALQISTYTVAFDREEAHIERSLSRLRRDIAFLQRYEVCVPTPTSSPTPGDPASLVSCGRTTHQEQQAIEAQLVASLQAEADAAAAATPGKTPERVVNPFQPLQTPQWDQVVEKEFQELTQAVLNQWDQAVAKLKPQT
jgi:hypothetical protein